MGIRRNKLLLRTLLLSAVLMASALGVAATPASAHVWGQSGSPGGMSTSGYVNAYAGTSVGEGINFGGVSVTRSPAYSSSTQVAKVTFRLYAWDGAAQSWRLYQDDVASVTMQPGSLGGRAAAHKMILLNPWTIYNAAVIVTWRTVGGTFIGSHTLDYNLQSEYHCLTDYNSCRPSESLAGFAGVFLYY